MVAFIATHGHSGVFGGPLGDAPFDEQTFFPPNSSDVQRAKDAGENIKFFKLEN